jgi:microsomal dipeptidase-like Zn-dependent dipeptidase
MTANSSGNPRRAVLVCIALALLSVSTVASWAMKTGTVACMRPATLTFFCGIALFLGLLRSYTWARLISVLFVLALLLAGIFIEAVAHSVRHQWPLAGDWAVGFYLFCFLAIFLYLLFWWPGSRKTDYLAFGLPIVTIAGIAVFVWGFRCRVPAQQDASLHNSGIARHLMEANREMDGFADTHTHPFANMAYGGCLFWGSAFGPESDALESCEPAHRFQLFRWKRGKDNDYKGFDSYSVWPAWNNGRHQLMYESWLYRAYTGGMRLMVLHAVNNEPLCRAAEILRHSAPARSCDDPSVVRQQLETAYKMQDSIDRDNGGPGKGWFRIVKSAEEARTAVRQGRLAVVLGIEVDRPFPCQQTTCNEKQLRLGLSEYYKLGVRHFFPIHLSDSAFGGMAVYEDIFSLTNFVLRGYFTDVEECGQELYGFRLTIRWPPVRMKATCNKYGLTPLGKILIQQLMQQRMIIDIDHMSRNAISDTLQITQGADYPVIAGHTSFRDALPDWRRSEYSKTPEQLHTITAHHGLVAAGLAEVGEVKGAPRECKDTSRAWLAIYRYAVEENGGEKNAAIALSSDQSFVSLIAPRFGKDSCDGLPAPKPNQKDSQWDFNTQGMANVGMYRDFIEDLKTIQRDDAELRPLRRSAERYIQMWEKIENESSQMK